MTEFLARLKQRKLVQWALAYLAAGWAALQALGLAADSYDWPHRVMQVAFAAIAFGFVVALVLAWYHGEKGRQRVSGAELLLITLVLAIGGGLLWRFERGAPSTTSPGTASSPDAAQRNPGATPSAIPIAAIPAKSIAVLPFENLSTDKGNAYFADGMQDLILTKLADIGQLKVISRTSTMKYASHPDDLKTIAQQLGVATVLEGSVQKAGNQVLINVQLIDARSDNHLWAESYTRTLDNIFGVEGEVAQKVADALQAKLSSTQQQNVAAIPTRNPQAYDAFLKAESLAFKAADSEDESDYVAADAAYRQAIALDPDFALAYAQRVVNLMFRHWFAQPLSAAELADVKALADRALALDPDLPEAHLALGNYYYRGFRSYDEAVLQFQRTLQLAPNNLGALAGLAYIDRRTGKFDQALAAFAKAVSLAPRDRILLAEYGITLEIPRRYAEAEQQLSRALAVDSMYADAKDFLVRIHLFGFGDAPSARAAISPPPAWRIPHGNNLAGDVFNLVNPRAYPDLFDRHFDAALRDWDPAPVDTQEERLTQSAARVAIQVIAGRQATIQSECGRLEPLLEAELTKYPNSLSALQQASWVNVCLGRNAEALAAARRATDLRPLSKDTYFGVFQLEGQAEIAAHAGAPGEALKLIEKLMAMPAGESMSIERLKLDPVWDPLRNDPRFQALLGKYATARPASTASATGS